MGKVIPPVRVHALHPQLLYGYGKMEMAQEKAKRIPGANKSLGQILVAVRVAGDPGCCTIAAGKFRVGWIGPFSRL